MTVEHWLEAALADALAQRLPGLAPLLHGLADAMRALRIADWNDDASGGARVAERRGTSEVGADTPDKPAVSSVANRHQWVAARSHPCPDPLTRLPVSTLSQRIARREISSEQLVRACLENIASYDTTYRAFVTVTADAALAQARALDHELARRGPRGPLHGIPVSLKDLIDQAGVPTTAASAVRRPAAAGSDAPVVARLRNAGAVLIGKTNLHEFAFGTTSDETAFGPVRNPYAVDRSPGGSSGGSAVSIVTGMAAASVGTDTGGSIRIPSAACGLVGLKPTWGEVPAAGVVPLSRSLDHVGPIARTVGDAWLLYLVLAGRHLEACWPLPARHDVLGLRVGFLRPYFCDILTPAVRAACDDALACLTEAGATVANTALPHATVTSAVYQLISLPEASAYHASAVLTHGENYTPNVRLRIESGRRLLAEDTVRAQQGREVLRAEVDRLLTTFDVLALPTLPLPAQPIGATTIEIDGTVRAVRPLMLRLTQLFNVTGHPAISLPIGWTPDGLPIGLQLIGRREQTDTLLAHASACERVFAARAAGHA